MVVMGPAVSTPRCAAPTALAGRAARGGSLLLSVAFLLLACGDDHGPVAGLLEIGTSDYTQDPARPVFQPLHDGDLIEGGLMDGIPWIPVNLRADADPRAPDATVTVTRGWVKVGEYPHPPRFDMEPDGATNVFWDLQIIFTVLECCFELDEVLLEASLRDAAGQLFEGEVRVRPLTDPLHLDPEYAACCRDADCCPNPSMTHLCDP